MVPLSPLVRYMYLKEARARLKPRFANGSGRSRSGQGSVRWRYGLTVPTRPGTPWSRGGTQQPTSPPICARTTTAVLISVSPPGTSVPGLVSSGVTEWSLVEPFGGVRPAERFMELSLSGATQDAVKFALSMLDVGTREEEIIVDVLAVSQRRVGERWHKNDLSVADEHLATGVAEATLCALASDTPPPTGHGSVVVACAEGDWHSIAAHMISEQLRAEGIRVIFLGASTPADSVARMLGQYRPNALAVSCNLALFFGGITRLADAAHVHGVPVLAGGRALQSAPGTSTGPWC